MNLFMDILSLILTLFTLYTAVIHVFCLLPEKKRQAAPPDTRFAVLIPARNEAAVISGIVESLKHQNYPKDKFCIYVIPNNCTDGTELAARMAGAEILKCTGPVTCKGDVLHQVFRQLKGQYDAYCIFDADNQVHPEFLARMNDAASAGALCAKGRQMATNPYASWISGCYDIYFAECMLLYNRARAALRLSAKLIGTGFMVTDKLLGQLGGWNTRTLTEDVEFSAQCAAAGVRIHYVPEALTYDEQPTSFSLSLRQRRRWSAGFLHTAALYIPKLFTRRPSWLRLDMSVTLALFYAQFLPLLPAVYSLIGLSFRNACQTLLLWLVCFWCGATVLAFLLSLSAGRRPANMWRSILLYPVFLISWYPLNLITLFHPPKTWQPIAHRGSIKK